MGNKLFSENPPLITGTLVSRETFDTVTTIIYIRLLAIVGWQLISVRHHLSMPLYPGVSLFTFYVIADCRYL